MGRLTDKRIWITGASGGLGERLAYSCAAEGAHVFIREAGGPLAGSEKTITRAAGSVMSFRLTSGMQKRLKT